MTADLPFSERNLILTGYTGPNQPGLGKAVAERLRMPFVDFDHLIEVREGETPEEIRTHYGERRLRTIEDELMDEVALRRKALVRIDGQTLLRSDHFPRLLETGPVICLVAQLDAVLQRLHLNMGARYHDPHERALAIGQIKREWAVRELEGVHEIDVTYMDKDRAIDEIINIWLSDSMRG